MELAARGAKGSAFSFGGGGSEAAGVEEVGSSVLAVAVSIINAGHPSAPAAREKALRFVLNATAHAGLRAEVIHPPYRASSLIRNSMPP